jgi:hypothetical protein
MRDRSFGRGGDDDRDSRRRREWARLQDEDMRDIRGSEDQHPLSGRERGEFERQYGSGSGPESYATRDYAHTGSFSGTGADFGEPSGRHRPRGRDHDYGSGDRGFVSRERTRLGRGSAEGYGQRNLETGGRNDGEPVSGDRPRASAFDDEPPSFGMNMQGNFGFDRGGQGLPGGGYFGGSDRGRATNSGLASSHGQSGGDLDRGFAGNSAAGGTDRGYGGGFNYGFGGNAYRSGMAHDRFEEASRYREQEQTMRGDAGRYRGVGPRSFKRDDARLCELVCERLADHDDIDASEIDVSVENGIVRLSGTVPDRRTKRLAEHVADSVGGIKDVDNQLRLGPADAQATSDTR